MAARRDSVSILTIFCLLASTLLATPAAGRDHRSGGFNRHHHHGGNFNHHHHRHHGGFHHHQRGTVFLGLGLGCCGFPYYRSYDPTYYPPVYAEPPPSVYVEPLPPVYVEPPPPVVASPPVAPSAPPHASASPDSYCRQFRSPVIIDGTTLPAHGFACRLPDGSVVPGSIWRLTHRARRRPPYTCLAARTSPERARLHGMEDAKDLRNRANEWRKIAVHQKHGAADAMIEAACELELKAVRLEREPQGRQQPKR